MTDPTHSGLNPIEHSTLSSHSASSLSPSTSIMVSLNRTHYNPRNSRSSSDRRPPGTLSSTTKDTKLEHIIQNFYTKTAQMIIQSRVSSDKLRRSVNKLNRWFNISTGDCEQLKEQLNFWKSLVYRQRDEPMPPLIIDIYMDDTPELCKEGSCVYGWTDSSIQANKHKKIILESWILTLNHPMPDASFDLPSLYKKAILFFRTLHSLIRLLPSHELYRRMKEYDDASLGYILSTHMNHRAQSVFQSDTIANNIFKDYEFTEVPTPLGTFKLKLSYREQMHVTMTENIFMHEIDMDENFFAPNRRYRKEDTFLVSRPSTSPIPMISNSSTTSSKSTDSRSHSIRSSSSTRFPGLNQSDRRTSITMISPFKSPSLSSSPQVDIPYSSPSIRSNPPEKSKLDSGSFSRKIEFSSSFEKYRNGSMNKVTTNTTDVATSVNMMRRWSRTSDHSSINLESEEEEDYLEEFMKFIASKKELKVFNNPSNVEETKEIPEEENKKSLSYFRNIQGVHNVLSESVMNVQQQQQKEPENPDDAVKTLNIPAAPSPLHHTQTLADKIPRVLPPSVAPISNAKEYHGYSDPLFSNMFTMEGDYSRSDQIMYHPTESITSPRLKHKAGPASQKQTSITGDDDDSLVFKMSELGTYEDNPSEGSKVYNQDVSTTKDYATRLKGAYGRGIRRPESTQSLSLLVTKDDAPSQPLASRGHSQPISPMNHSQSLVYTGQSQPLSPIGQTHSRGLSQPLSPIDQTHSRGHSQSLSPIAQTHSGGHSQSLSPIAQTHSGGYSQPMPSGQLTTSKAQNQSLLSTDKNQSPVTRSHSQPMIHMDYHLPRDQNQPISSRDHDQVTTSMGYNQPNVSSGYSQQKSSFIQNQPTVFRGHTKPISTMDPNHPGGHSQPISPIDHNEPNVSSTLSQQKSPVIHNQPMVFRGNTQPISTMSPNQPTVFRDHRHPISTKDHDQPMPFIDYNQPNVSSEHIQQNSPVNHNLPTVFKGHAKPISPRDPNHPGGYSQPISPNDYNQPISSMDYNQTNASSKHIQQNAPLNHNQPAMFRGHTKPISLMDPYQQALFRDHSQPTSSMDHNQPLVSEDHDTSTSSMENNQPAASKGHSQPIPSLDHSQSTVSRGQNQPKSSMDHSQKTVSRAPNQPIAPKDDSQPISSMDHDHPTSSQGYNQPISIMDQPTGSDQPVVSRSHNQPTVPRDHSRPLSPRGHKNPNTTT